MQSESNVSVQTHAPENPPFTTTSAPATSAPANINSEQSPELQGSFVELTPLQLQAADLLAQGQRLTHVATTLGVSRATLYRWKTQHPPFIAALNRRHKETMDALSVHVSTILTDAVHEVGKALKNKRAKGRRLDAALAVLKTFGTRKLLQPVGPTSQDAALRHIAIQRRAETCQPLTTPLSYDELQRVLDELQYELRDVVFTKYSTFDVNGQPYVKPDLEAEARAFAAANPSPLNDPHPRDIEREAPSPAI